MVDCYSIGGDTDFLLYIVGAYLDYNADFAMSAVCRVPGIKEMQSMFVLKEIKSLVNFPIKSDQNKLPLLGWSGYGLWRK